MEKYQDPVVQDLCKSEYCNIWIRLKWKSTWQKPVLLDLINSDPKWDPLSAPGSQCCIQLQHFPDLRYLCWGNWRKSGWDNLFKTQLLPTKKCWCIFLKGGHFDYRLASSVHLPSYQGVWFWAYAFTSVGIYTGQIFLCLFFWLSLHTYCGWR